MKFICAIISAILINFALSEILAKSFLQDEIKIKVNFYKIVHIPIKAMTWTAF